MNPRQLFLEYPELDEVYQAGNSEAFVEENDAKDYANHYNVSMRKVLREEVSGLPERKTEKKLFIDEDLEGVDVDEDGKISDDGKAKLIENFVTRKVSEVKAKKSKAVESPKQETTNTEGNELPKQETTNTEVIEPPKQETTNAEGNEPPKQETTNAEGNEPPAPTE